METELGWSVVDVDSFIEFNTPPDMFTVAQGEFGEDPLAAEGLIDLGNGVVSAGEGDDGIYDLPNITPARPQGQPLRMAHQDGRIAASWSTPAVEGWLGDTDETLADNERLLAVAETLDNVDVVSAYLVQGGFDIEETEAPLAPELLEELSGQVIPEAFDTVGIGWVVNDEGGSRIEVAYHFSDEATAENATESLRTIFETGETSRSRQPLSELLTLDGITNEGSIVLATLQPGPNGHVRTVLEMLVQKDLPFSHR